MPKDRPAKVDKKLAKLENQVAELTADLQRVQADFVNFRRRSDEEKGQIMQHAKEEVILHLLPVIDDIDLALSHAAKTDEKNPWVEGMKKIKNKTLAALEDMGLEVVRAKGQDFDPEQHEAVEFIESEGDKEKVAEVLRRGYKLNGKVIRHSIVKVKKENNNG